MPYYYALGLTVGLAISCFLNGFQLFISCKRGKGRKAEIETTFYANNQTDVSGLEATAMDVVDQSDEGNATVEGDTVAETTV